MVSFPFRLNPMTATWHHLRNGRLYSDIQSRYRNVSAPSPSQSSCHFCSLLPYMSGSPRLCMSRCPLGLGAVIQQRHHVQFPFSRPESTTEKLNLDLARPVQLPSRSPHRTYVQSSSSSNEVAIDGNVQQGRVLHSGSPDC